MSNSKINWKNAIIGGILGTVLFDLLGLLITGEWWDVPSLLGAKTGLGQVYGVGAHYGNGILLAVLYAGISPSLWGPHWLRVTTFLVAETIALVWLFMFPLVGAGIAGTEMGAMVPFVSLLRHLIYGVPVYIFVHGMSAKKSSD